MMHQSSDTIYLETNSRKQKVLNYDNFYIQPKKTLERPTQPKKTRLILFKTKVTSHQLSDYCRIKLMKVVTRFDQSLKV